MEHTTLFSLEDIDNAIVSKTLIEVYDSLKKKGYNPTNQIVGYLMSGDPGYISSHKEARNKIIKFDDRLMKGLTITARNILENLERLEKESEGMISKIIGGECNE